MTSPLLDRRRKRYEYARHCGHPTSLVDAAPIRAHVHALTALGWLPGTIAAWARVGTGAGVVRIAQGLHVDAERKWLPILDLPLTLHVASHIPDPLHVPAEGAVRRIEALLAMGWRHPDLTPRLGLRSCRITRCDQGRHISARSWRAIAATYTDLADTPGPSPLTASRSRRAGNRPPAAWDDIDSPTEQPTSVVDDDLVDDVVVARVLAGERLPTTRAEKLAIATTARDRGMNLTQLERVVGWNVHEALAAARARLQEAS